jgi:hypothetical protein
MPAVSHGYKMMAACLITCNNLLQKWITFSMVILQMFHWWHVMLLVCVSEDVGPTAYAPCNTQDPVWLDVYHQCTHSITLALDKQSASVLAHGMHQCGPVLVFPVLVCPFFAAYLFMTCAAKPQPMSVTQAEPQMTHNHLWISAGWQPSSLRNWITAPLSYMDGFTTSYEILSLHCNVIYSGYSLSQPHFSTHVSAGVFTELNVQLNYLHCYINTINELQSYMPHASTEAFTILWRTVQWSELQLDLWLDAWVDAVAWQPQLPSWLVSW